jgi:hypothetical protein
MDRKIKERRRQRYMQLKNCLTPEELSWKIWTKELEDAMQSNRDCYRKPFVLWIEEYASNLPYSIWKYGTPMELANDIWVSFGNEKDRHFDTLRTILVNWIENYKNRKVDKKYGKDENTVYNG